MSEEVAAEVRPAEDAVPLPPEKASQLASFLHFCRLEKGLSRNTLDAYSADLTRFMEFSRGASDLGSAAVGPYLDRLTQAGLSNRSVARHLTTLRCFYGF